MTLTPQAQKLQDKYEIRPDPVALTQNSDASQNSSTGVDYEPHPENSIKVDEKQQKIVDSICRLYSGSASEDDMQVYAAEAIYDDPWSYCDTRYKIAGQWYGTGFDFLPHLYLLNSRKSLFDFCLRHLQAFP